MSLHPPKPRLTLRIGVTGHRPNKLEQTAIPRIRRQLRDTFAAIEAIAAKMRGENTAFYAAEAPLIRLISGFAEGVDQFAVQESPTGWQIEAILPFPRDEYLADFTRSAGDGSDVRTELVALLGRATTVTELPRQHSENRNQGYADAGAFMLRQIDVLLAVWDGLPPRRGGTGAVARHACAAGIPVVWISSREDRNPSLIAAFDEQGAPVASAAVAMERSLHAALNWTFSAPLGSAGENDSGASRLGRYLSERWPSGFQFSAYDALYRLASGRLPRLAIAQRALGERLREWDGFVQSAPEAKALREQILRILLPRAAWADALAVRYSHFYRSAYVLAYVLSAFAVFVGATTVFIHDDPRARAAEVLGSKAVITGIELLVIGTIITLVWLGRRHAWHQCWLEYRALAEMLRHARFLAFVGEFGRADEPLGARQAHWTVWYARATMREIGLASTTLDERYQERILGATLGEEIEGPNGQIAYHAASRKAAHRIDHVLHHAGTACFLLTGIILLVFLLMFALESLFAVASLEKLLLSAKPFVTFASVGLPALGAAVSGIRAHADFEGSAERSARMIGRLERLKADYNKSLTDAPSLDVTADLLIATAASLSEELSAWQELYGRKRLTLPA